MIKDSILVSVTNLAQLVNIMGILIGTFSIVAIVKLPSESSSIGCLFDLDFLTSMPNSRATIQLNLFSMEMF